MKFEIELEEPAFKVGDVLEVFENGREKPATKTVLVHSFTAEATLAFKNGAVQVPEMFYYYVFSVQEATVEAFKVRPGTTWGGYSEKIDEMSSKIEWKNPIPMDTTENWIPRMKVWEETPEIYAEFCAK